MRTTFVAKMVLLLKIPSSQAGAFQYLDTGQNFAVLLQVCWCVSARFSQGQNVSYGSVNSNFASGLIDGARLGKDNNVRYVPPGPARVGIVGVPCEDGSFTTDRIIVRVV